MRKITKQQNKIPKLRFPEFSGEWEGKRLGDVADFWNGKAHEQDISEDGKYIVVNSKFISSDGEVKKYSNLQISPLKKDDIVIVMSDVPNGKAIAKCFLIDEDNKYTLNQRIGGIKSNDIISQFLFRVLDRNKYFLKFDNGVSQTNLRKDEILRCPIVFPSISEQQKIADFLGAVDEWIENLKGQKEELEKYKKGIMQKIFFQEIRFKDNNGKDFPGWEEKKLGEIGETYNGLTGKTKNDFGNGSKFITYKQIFDDTKIDISKCGFVKISANEKQNKVQYGDLFFTASSETPLEVGFSSVLVDKVEDVYLNSFCFGFRPKSLNILDPNFAQFFFRSFWVRKKIIRLAQGSTRYNISKIQFLKIKIKIPSLPEQQKIASFLSAIDKKIELVDAQIQKMQEWKRGLMQRLFM